MSTNKHPSIIEQIRTGLPFTQENAEIVMRGFVGEREFHSALGEAGLSGLPDPENCAGNSDVMRDWLVQAMQEADRLGGRKARSTKSLQALLEKHAQLLAA